MLKVFTRLAIVQCRELSQLNIHFTVQMLEFYEMDDEALNVLNNYASDRSFPPNPNAQVYLYHFLKKHDSPPKKIMTALKVQIQML